MHLLTKSYNCMTLTLIMPLINFTSKLYINNLFLNMLLFFYIKYDYYYHDDEEKMMMMILIIITDGAFSISMCLSL